MITMVSSTENPLSTRTERRDWFLFWSTALLMAIGLYHIEFGEHIRASGGVGFDGKTYYAVAKDFWGMVLGGEVRTYRITRILPSGIIYFLANTFDIQPTKANIIKLFSYYNLGLILLVNLFYFRLAGFLEIDRRIRSVGFFLLFMNFALAKVTYYYPVVTDTSGFALGFFLIYGCLKKQGWLILLVSAIGGFTWPKFPLFGLLAYTFLNDNVTRESNSARLIALAKRIKCRRLVSTSVATLVSLALIYLNYIEKFQLKPRLPQVNQSLFLVSVACVWMHLYLSFRLLIDDRIAAQALSYLNPKRNKKIYGVFIFLIVFSFIVYNLPSKPIGFRHDPRITLFFLSIVRPLNYLVAHISYFGPVVIIFMVFFPRIGSLLHEKGIALTLLMAAQMIMSIGSESRQLIDFLPFVAITVIMALNGIQIRKSDVAVVALTCLFFSKTWFRINLWPSFNWHYRFTLEPWMPDPVYFVQTGAALLMGIAIYHAILRKRQSRR